MVNLIVSCRLLPFFAGALSKSLWELGAEGEV